VVAPHENRLNETKLDLLQETLDIMVLQTFAALGSLHGYGIASRIEQVSGDQVLLNQGTICASRVRQTWLDLGEMGHIRQQSLSQVLLDYQTRTSAACG
jgi:hypothetical protein